MAAGDDFEGAAKEFYIIWFAIMVFFFVAAGANEKFKPACGHQTSFTIILGVTVALFLWVIHGDSRVDNYKFQ